MAPVHEEVHVGGEEGDGCGGRADDAVPELLAGDHFDEPPRVGDGGDHVDGPQDAPVAPEVRHVHDGDGAGHGVDEDDDVGDEFGVAAQLEEAGAFDDGGADGSRGVRRVRGGRQRVESGHGDAHELALFVAAGCPVFEELEGGHGDGRVAVARHSGLVDDVGAEGIA